MKFHPFSEIFPIIDDDDFDALVDDIKAHGLHEPVWLYQGKVLDGRNRLMACKAAGVEPKFREFEGDDAEALAFVVSSNVHRRHLTASQRAMAAAEIAKLEKGANQHAHKCAPSQGEAAESLKVSRRSVQNAKQVIEHGSKDLKRAVKSGEVAVTRAAEVVDLPKPQQLKAAKQKNEPAPKPLEITPEPEWTDEDEAQYMAEAERDAQARIETAMASDDRLAEAFAQIKAQQAEIVALKASRDHYQNQAGEAVRLVKARDREIEKLKRQLARAAA